MLDEERYKGNLNLYLIGKNNQEYLMKKNVLVIGAGALGSSILTLLARNGINLGIVDKDIVKKENLIRQILYDENDIGKKKVIAAKEKLSKINSDINIEIYDTWFDENSFTISKGYDILVGSTDNLKSRLIINEASIYYNIPSIYVAVEGQYGLIKPIIPGKTSCLRCFYKGNLNEEKHVILNSTPHAVSSMAVNLILKILLNNEIEDIMLYIDTWNFNIDKIKLKRDNNCKICVNKNFEFIKTK
ncbi:MAG: HesA/MoeB/ThiF family protein [Thermoplasmata archaeon]|jgi:adenylyltransferase/sulfurtransferase